MSDLCMYELEDLSWDGIVESDDHIVPHPGKEYEVERVLTNDSCKKPRREVLGIKNNADRSAKLGQGKEATDLSTPSNIRGKMLEDSWSNEHDQNMLPSEGTRMTNDGLKSSNMESADSNFGLNPNLNGKCVEVDNNLCQDPERELSQSESAIDFCNNRHEDNDLLDYEWPDIGNFEDVDQMLRNCDSTFGLVDASNEDELCWFPNSHTIDGSEECIKAGFKSSYSESSPFKSMMAQPNHESLLASEFDRRNVSDTYSTITRASNSVDPSSNVPNSYLNGLDKTSDFEGKHSLCKQVEAPGKQLKQSIEDGAYFYSESMKEQPEARYSERPNIKSEVCRSSEAEVSSSEVEDHTTKVFVNSDSSGAQQGSSISAVLNEESPEESSFRHLQQVMEQLDIRTKLCIRDSLYRLARSAEQRHSSADLDGGTLITDTKCTGFLDIETDTNPIDRSIAHLLFHRPSNASVMSPKQATLPKSRIPDHQPGLLTDDMVCMEQTAAGVDRMLLITEKKKWPK